MKLNDVVRDVSGFIAKEISYWGNLLTRVDLINCILALSLLSLVLLVLYLLQRKRIKNLDRRAKILERLYSGFQAAPDMEKTLDEMLDIVRSLAKAESYYFYLQDPKKEQYILKAVRHSEDGEEPITPSYSGLLSYKREEILPPLSLPAEAQVAATTLSKDGPVNFLTVPVTGGKGLIRVGPFKRLSAHRRKALDELGFLFGPVLDILIETESLRNQVGVHVASSRALQNAANVTMDFEATLGMVMSLSLRMIGGSGGCFIIEDGDKYGMPYLSAPANEEEERFRRDADAHGRLVRLLGNENICVIAKRDQKYDELPSYLKAGDIELLILLKVAAKNNKGLAAFWYKEMPEIETHRLTGLQMMTKRMSDLLDSNHRYKEIADSYVDMLRMMVETIDNLEPRTVGYSELMARFSEIIAREMRMDDREIKDVVVAASLSNIGLLGFSNELLFKPGKYTDFEYDTMKLHSEVGASIIEATIANSKVASIIRYHHERMDGNGYPAGLKGEDIPMGARIIAVVQTFLATITGRRYRDPLPFEKALQLLHAACGTQLDPAVVHALFSWFKKKQASPARKGRSLGACWEMRCVPSGICMQCPAYQEREHNCWEIEGTKCEAHGNKCPSCFVYTEYIYRMGFKGDKPHCE